MDVYKSAKQSSEFLLTRIFDCGIVVYDDYGFQFCGGVTQYVNELKRNHRVIHNLNGHAILIK